MSDLVKLYSNRLEQLQGCTPAVNRTPLKEKILKAAPELQAHRTCQGKYETVLSYKDNIGDALVEASAQSADDSAMILMRSASIIRKVILEHQYRFQGHLNDKGYNNYPQTLRTLIQMIVDGSNIRAQTENHNRSQKAVDSISDLVVFNTTKRGRKESEHIRHNTNRETLTPLYTALVIYNKTRKRDLIDIMFEKRLSISYDRVLQLSSDLANSVIARYEGEAVVCPTPLRSGVYTTGNLDNIDHNPSSTSASDTFHGTAISLTQHVTASCPGTMGESALGHRVSNDERSQRIRPLPESYVLVPPTQVDKFAQPQNAVVGSLVPGSVLISSDDSHQRWLAELHRALEKDGPDASDNISWSAYNVSVETNRIILPAVTALLPETLPIPQQW